MSAVRGGYAEIDGWLFPIQHLVDLIKWLAMPYGDNSPVFATELPDGRPLETGKQMAELYYQIVGEKTPTPGVWKQCDICRQWFVAHPDSDRNLTDHDVVEMAKAYRDATR